MTLGHHLPCQEEPYPPSPGWILEGQDVLDKHSVGRVSPARQSRIIRKIRKPP